MRRKVPATVEVPEKGPVYKMRLITELIQSPGNISLDRLRRVQVHEGPREQAGFVRGGEEEVGLFDNVAVHFVEGAGGDEHRYYIGRVQKIFKQLPGEDIWSLRVFD